MHPFPDSSRILLRYFLIVFFFLLFWIFAVHVVVRVRGTMSLLRICKSDTVKNFIILKRGNGRSGFTDFGINLSFARGFYFEKKKKKKNSDSFRERRKLRERAERRRDAASEKIEFTSEYLLVLWSPVARLNWITSF